MSAQAARPVGRPVKLQAAQRTTPVPAEQRTVAVHLRLEAEAAEAYAALLQQQARTKREFAALLEQPPTVEPAPTVRTLVTVAEAARRFGISEYRLRQLVADGTLPALRDSTDAVMVPCRVWLEDVEALVRA